MARPKRPQAEKNSSPNSRGPSTPKKQRFGENDTSPGTLTSSSSGKRRQNQPRLSASKVDFLKPTWEDDPRPIMLHGEKANDEIWMAGYLGYNTKFLLRNLAMSPLVLPWAIEQNVFSWKPTEVPAAIRMLSESKEFGNGDVHLGLKAFEGASDVHREYLSAHEEGGKVNPKMVPNEKLNEELENLDPDTDQNKLREYYKDHRAQVEERVRGINHEIPYFSLPDVPLDRLEAPELGPVECNGRMEHLNEKWVRILTLLRYANSRVTKSKYTMAGCIGGTLGESDAQRKKLTEEARRRLIDIAGSKWLGLDEDWAEQTLDPSGMPVWMRAEFMDIDKTRKIQCKDPNKPERRPIKFEAVWMEDYPEDTPELGQRCRQFWKDAGLRDQFGIPQHVKTPDFADRGKRPELRDPRDFPGYPQWRDSLRVRLFFTSWKLDFDSAWLIDKRIIKSAIGQDLLLSADADDASERRCVKIYDCSGEDPTLDYDDFLAAIEKGQDTQTVAFLCEPLEGERIRHYPWETVLYLSGSNEEPRFTDEGDFSTAVGTSTAVEKDDENKTQPEEEPEQPQPSGEGELSTAVEN